MDLADDRVTRFAALTGPAGRALLAELADARVDDDTALRLSDRLRARFPPALVADGLTHAYALAEYLEYLCDVHLRALATGLPVRTLPPEEIDAVAARINPR